MFFQKKKKKSGPVQPIPVATWRTLHDNAPKVKREDALVNERNRDLARQLQFVR